MTERVVIIGAGHGGIQVATSLREGGYKGDIVMISDEADLPYQKPPLSKGFLNGKQAVDNLLFRNSGFYADNNIQLVLGAQVVAIDLSAKTVTIHDNTTLEYTKLVLATGASNRKLSTGGTRDKDILYLRNMTDAQQMKSALEKADKIAVIGGGFIGLEIAAAAAEMGKGVTVIETQERLMNRVLPAVVSDVFYKRHLEKGVSVLLNARIDSISDTFRITLKNNTVVDADLIIAGIGVLPNSEIAEKAGLACSNGINVNAYLETSDPSVYAIGDCACYYNDFAERTMRVESVQNAVDQAKCVANTILGKKEKYRAVPWFWTNQYDLKLQMAGIAVDFDTCILRGGVESNKFSAFYFKNEKLVGVDSLNRPADHLLARKLLEAGISPTYAQVSDVDFKLNMLIKS